jgi:lambda repressor-like predicted transcriptional regulator
MQPRFDSTEARQLGTQYKAGATIYDLASEHGCSTAAICNALDRIGVKRRAPSFAKTKLNESQGRGLRREYEAGASLETLARREGVGRVAIRNAVVRAGGVLRKEGGWSKRPQSEIDAIIARRREGVSQEVIASEFGATQSTISQILRRAGLATQHRKDTAWRPKPRLTREGYRMVFLDSADVLAAMANCNGYVMEHRLVMARDLGRPLLRSEQVHHIDGDRSNNAIENLQLRQGSHGNGAVHVCLDCGSVNVEVRRL